MEQCPCGSGKAYDECCGPVIAGTRTAETAEELMRSRYSAYVKGEVEHIVKSTSTKQRQELDEQATRHWAESSEWHGLEIVGTDAGGPQDSKGTVEFVASYEDDEGYKRHHEVGRFIKQGGSWYYEDGEMVKARPVVREQPKVGRNDPCPCGSGKKYKKCCALKAGG